MNGVHKNDCKPRLLKQCALPKELLNAGRLIECILGVMCHERCVHKECPKCRSVGYVTKNKSLAQIKIV